MKTRMLLALILVGSPLFAVSARFENAVKARIESGYATVLFGDGTKGVFPLAQMSEEDRAWLGTLSAENPLPRGKSEFKVVKETATATVKNTIQVSTTVGPLETVQLVPPNVMRDQIDATCMLYARVHWLDIAGFYLPLVDLYKIINNSNPARPWADPFYRQSLVNLMYGFTPRPVFHRLPGQADPFKWTRDELRKGRPVLASFPREVWQDLPPGFIAAHPWSGGDVGHQVVINGFTWNKDTQQGTFHIINSWKELPEFDLKTEAATGALVIEQSLSPKGEEREKAAKVTIINVTLVSSMGKTNLYRVDTSDGIRKVAAPNADAARSMVDSEGSGP
jgi:hypothetical protein